MGDAVQGRAMEGGRGEGEDADLVAACELGGRIARGEVMSREALGRSAEGDSVVKRTLPSWPEAALSEGGEDAVERKEAFGEGPASTRRKESPPNSVGLDSR